MAYAAAIAGVTFTFLTGAGIATFATVKLA
jgi:hypothetical protein